MVESLKPPPDPINYEAHDVELNGKILHVPEVSHSTRADWAIRTMMERALRYSDEEVLIITKELAEVDVKALHSVELSRPFTTPALSDTGSNNSLLKEFAFDAYDVLNGHFGFIEWTDWFIAPYFDLGDDLGDRFWLGVFVADTFDETVVE